MRTVEKMTNTVPYNEDDSKFLEMWSSIALTGIKN